MYKYSFTHKCVQLLHIIFFYLFQDPIVVIETTSEPEIIAEPAPNVNLRTKVNNYIFI